MGSARSRRRGTQEAKRASAFGRSFTRCGRRFYSCGDDSRTTATTTAPAAATAVVCPTRGSNSCPYGCSRSDTNGYSCSSPHGHCCSSDELFAGCRQGSSSVCGYAQLGNCTNVRRVNAKLASCCDPNRIFWRRFSSWTKEVSNVCADSDADINASCGSSATCGSCSSCTNASVCNGIFSRNSIPSYRVRVAADKYQHASAGHGGSDDAAGSRGARSVPCTRASVSGPGNAA